ncbi:DUF1801 domain-containing protein [Tomitella fengzijianii]|nr:DUF1801 domain-containing protein [Tomitella fengzijianii]
MTDKTTETMSPQERAAIKERAAELKAQGRSAKAADKAAANEAALLAKIAEMPQPDRSLAERVHAIVTACAPDLQPKLYYGQPGYARKGKVLCFFRSGQDDKERYSTFGFSMQADLDDTSGLWATSYALTEPTEAAWAELEKLISKATR